MIASRALVRIIVLSAVLLAVSDCTKAIFREHGVSGMTYDEFNQKIRLVKEGMTEKEVLAILGAPDDRGNTLWIYSKFEGTARPPKIGEQYFYGAELSFENGVLKKISTAWVDATGMQ